MMKKKWKDKWTDASNYYNSSGTFPSVYQMGVEDERPKFYAAEQIFRCKICKEDFLAPPELKTHFEKEHEDVLATMSLAEMEVVFGIKPPPAFVWDKDGGMKPLPSEHSKNSWWAYTKPEHTYHNNHTHTNTDDKHYLP